MALFRYFPANLGIEALALRALMVTPPKYFNDPFEFSPVIKCKDPRASARRKFEEMLTLPYFNANKERLVGLDFDEYSEGVRRRKTQLLQLIEEETIPATDLEMQNNVLNFLSKSFGVICFVADGLHPTMWAHYAGAHTGIVIEFDQDHLLFSGPSFLVMEYSDERVTYDASDVANPDHIELFAKRKGSHWKDERESRLVLNLSNTTTHDTAEGPRYFLPIDGKLIVSVTLGLRISGDSKREIMQLLDAPDYAHVELFEMRQDPATAVFGRNKI